mgnify:CR=1 FL=1
MLQDRYSLAFKLYPYERSPDQDAEAPVRRRVVVMGGGPIGLATALDLGLQGIPVVLLDDHEGVGQGSRAICFAKRTLEIADRYGCSAAMLDKGVVWNVGKVFHEEPQVLHYGRAGTGLELKEGMTFTIEPMINQGRSETRLLGDGWTAITKDRKLSAQWEHTILVTADGYEIFTLRSDDTIARTSP